MKHKFESGISDFVHVPITVDVTFPVDRKGVAVVVCEYCKLFTGRRCTITEEVIFNPQNFVGYNCPLKNKEE